MVTNINIVRDIIYTSFYKGMITRFDLKNFRRDNMIYQFKNKIVNFKVEHDHDVLTIEAVSYDGSLETRKYERQMNY